MSTPMRWQRAQCRCGCDIMYCSASPDACIHCKEAICRDCICGGSGPLGSPLRFFHRECHMQCERLRAHIIELVRGPMTLRQLKRVEELCGYLSPGAIERAYQDHVAESAEACGGLTGVVTDLGDQDP